MTSAHGRVPAGKAAARPSRGLPERLVSPLQGDVRRPALAALDDRSSLIAERVRAGLARARSEGKRLGAPQLLRHSKSESVRPWRLLGGPVRVIAKQFGVDPRTVQRLDQSSVSLTRWGFPNQLQNDSRWRTEGHLPWGLPLRCGGTIPAARVLIIGIWY
jgi:hypothetical protein